MEDLNSMTESYSIARQSLALWIARPIVWQNDQRNSQKSHANPKRVNHDGVLAKEALIVSKFKWFLKQQITFRRTLIPLIYQISQLISFDMIRRIKPTRTFTQLFDLTIDQSLAHTLKWTKVLTVTQHNWYFYTYQLTTHKHTRLLLRWQST